MWVLWQIKVLSKFLSPFSIPVLQWCIDRNNWERREECIFVASFHEILNTLTDLLLLDGMICFLVYCFQSYKKKNVLELKKKKEKLCYDHFTLLSLVKFLYLFMWLNFKLQKWYGTSKSLPHRSSTSTANFVSFNARIMHPLLTRLLAKSLFLCQKDPPLSATMNMAVLKFNYA